MEKEQNGRVVTDPAEFRDLIAAMRTSGKVGFDTEFVGERTFFPRLCLIQLGTETMSVAVDPLAVGDLSPLDDLLFDPSVLKLVHAGWQDLKIIHQRTGRVPAPVFDTQIAAALLGLPAQAAYASVVHEFLRVEVKKGHSYSDWAARPLSPSQLAYALDDVRYLPALHDRMIERLTREGRLSWIEPEIAALSSPASYETDPDQEYRRVKGWASLDRRRLAVLRQAHDLLQQSFVSIRLFEKPHAHFEGQDWPHRRLDLRRRHHLEQVHVTEQRGLEVHALLEEAHRVALHPFVRLFTGDPLFGELQQYGPREHDPARAIQILAHPVGIDHHARDDAGEAPEHVIENLKLDESSTAIALFGADGRVLARYPSERSIWFLWCNEEHKPWTSIIAANQCRQRGDNLVAIFNVDSIGGKSDADIAAGRKPYLDGFHIAHDNWHSTHSPENTQLSQDIYRRLKAAGFIYTKTIEQLYDPMKGMFLADRYIKGECPNCGAKDQYGDNCEVCGAVYSPTELKNPYSALSGATPVLKSSVSKQA